MVSTNLAVHLRVDDTVDDILTHPAFAGFGRLLLPWDDRVYNKTIPLRDIGSLLPYHTQVDPVIVVASLNRMIDAARAGRPVFHLTRQIVFRSTEHNAPAATAGAVTRMAAGCRQMFEP